MTRSATRTARLAVLALLPLAGCARTEQMTGNAMTEGQAVMQAQTNPTLSTVDAYFMDQAARSGVAEWQQGRLAGQTAARADVRRFAAQEVQDDTGVNQKLMALAQQKRISPPTAPSTVQAAEITTLRGLSGTAFDRQYLDGQVAMQQAAIALFRNEAQNGTDPDVKRFATAALPTLEHDLHMAQQLGGLAPAS